MAPSLFPNFRSSHRRIRSEREGAYERERQLKKGLTTLRQERDEMAASLASAQSALQREGDSAELSHTKRCALWLPVSAFSPTKTEE